MRCAFIYCLSLYISTCLAVLYSGETPQYTAAAAVEQQLQQQQQIKQQQLHQLQFQQRQWQQQPQQHFANQQSLPDYNNDFPQSPMNPTSPAESSHVLAGYRYTAPVAIAPTTFRPLKITTAIATNTTDSQQTPNLGYTYGLPVDENSQRHAYYAPYHQINRLTAATLQSSTSNYFDPLQSVGLSSEATSNIFATNEVPDETLEPQAPKSQPTTKKEKQSEEDVRKLLTPYQRVFREFADYLLWKKVHDGELTQQRRLQQFKPLQLKQNTQEQLHVNLPSLQNQVASTAPPVSLSVSNYHATQPTPIASLAQQTYPHSTQMTPRNEFTLQRPALARQPTISKGALGCGERYLSNDNNNNNNLNYISKPSESWELPSYNNVDFAVPQQMKVSIGHRQEAGAFDQYESVDKAQIRGGTIGESGALYWKQQQQQTQFPLVTQSFADESKREFQTQSQFIKPAGELFAQTSLGNHLQQHLPVQQLLQQQRQMKQQQQQQQQQTAPYFHSTQASPKPTHNSQLSSQFTQSTLSNFNSIGDFNSDTATLRRPYTTYGVPLRGAVTE